MAKKKIDHTTSAKGIFIYDPSASKTRYYLQFRYGTDPKTGKSQTIKRMVDRDKSHITSFKRAQEYMQELKDEYDRDRKVNFNNQMLYSDFMDNIYIPAYKTNVEESTFRSRTQNLSDIRDRFANKSLKEITPQDAQEFRTWLLTPKENDGGGYAQSTASMIFGMFRKTLDNAVELNFLENNVTKKIKAISKGKTNINYWTKKDFEKIIAQIYIDDYYQHLQFVMLWVYFTTGVRVNEGCALYWNDIDYKNKTIRIHHTLDFKSKTNWTRKNYTKTTSGKRIISLDDDTLEILKKWQSRQTSQCKSNFIFSYDGNPMQKSTIGRIIKRYAELAHIHKIQAKGLRHSHASWLINEFNIDILMLSRRLGHSSPEITLKHYSHLYPNRDHIIAQNITGSIDIKTSEKNHSKFNGNQAIKTKDNQDKKK